MIWYVSIWRFPTFTELQSVNLLPIEKTLPILFFFWLLYSYNTQHGFFCYILFQKLCWFHVYDYLPLGMIEQLNMLYRHGTGRHKGWKASLALLTYILCLITDLLCNYVNGTVGVLASSRVNILFMTILHALPKPFDRNSIWITKDRNRRRLISGIYPPVYQTVSPVTGMGWGGRGLGDNVGFKSGLFSNQNLFTLFSCISLSALLSVYRRDCYF